MHLKVVVVSPKYQINVGYIARVSMNFGVGSLEFVQPRCKIRGGTAIKYSKAAHGLLERAKQSKTLEEAISGTFSIATTGVWRKGGSVKGIYTISEALKSIKRTRPQSISIVLGRDDTGMKPEEIQACSMALFIPANPDYPVLNISHALAILLHSLRDNEISAAYKELDAQNATQSDKDALSRLFKLFVYQSPSVKDKRAVYASFKSVVDKSVPTKKELRSIAAALSIRKNKK